jgi:hypothetical protein
MSLISVYRGSTKTLVLTVRDQAGTAVNLTGAAIFFTVKNDADETLPVISKSTAVVTQIAITNPTLGVAQIYLVPSDTQNLDTRQYEYDIWVVLSTNNRHCVLRNVLTVEASITVIV